MKYNVRVYKLFEVEALDADEAADQVRSALSQGGGGFQLMVELAEGDQAKGAEAMEETLAALRRSNDER